MGQEEKSILSSLKKVTKFLQASIAHEQIQGTHTRTAYQEVIKPIENIIRYMETKTSPAKKGFSTRVSVDMNDDKKSLDEIALARVCAMATHSLDPETFSLYAKAHNMLIETRTLQNDVISYE